MESIVTAVTNGVTILGAVVSVYLAIGVASAFVGGQLDAVTGRPSGRDITGRIALLVMCVALVAFAQTISSDVAALVGGDLTGAGEVRNAVLNVGEYFLDILIGTAAVLLAIGIITGFVGAQLATAAGEAVAASNVVGRVLILIGLTAGALFTTTIVHIVISAMR